MFEINNRINAAGGGIESVLIVVVLILMARAIHHVFVKKPRRIVKRETNKQTNERIIRIENAL